jgi:hypothetical protein
LDEAWSPPANSGHVKSCRGRFIQMRVCDHRRVRSSATDGASARQRCNFTEADVRRAQRRNDGVVVARAHANHSRGRIVADGPPQERILARGYDEDRTVGAVTRHHLCDRVPRRQLHRCPGRPGATWLTALGKDDFGRRQATASTATASEHASTPVRTMCDTRTRFVWVSSGRAVAARLRRRTAALTAQQSPTVVIQRRRQDPPAHATRPRAACPARLTPRRYARRTRTWSRGRSG